MTPHRAHSALGPWPEATARPNREPAGLSSPGCTFRHVTSAPAPWTLLSYGPLPDQVAEVTVPTGVTGPLPLVLLLHGGVWREPHDRVHIRPLAAALAATGLLVANVDYRRVGGAGGWPETFEDVAAASDTLPDLIEAALGRRPPRPVVGGPAPD
jgi:acetyl esterase/lipase